MLSPEFVAAQTVSANVVRIARDWLTETLAILAGRPDEDAPASAAVHDARRGLKRLRALLRLARTGLGEEAFRRENIAARDAGRELSAVRDAQVLVAAFDSLKDDLAGRLAPEASAAVRGWLLERVRDAVTTLRTQDRLPRAVALLTVARERLDTLPWEGGEDDWDAPEAGLRKVYRAARHALRRAGDGGSEDDFHEWRKQVKHLGAQLALLRPLCPKDAARMGKALAKLADRLGDEHDLAVLAATLVEFRGETFPPAGLAAASEVIAERRADLRKKALRRGRRFFDERAGKFARRWRKGWKKLRGG